MTGARVNTEIERFSFAFYVYVLPPRPPMLRTGMNISVMLLPFQSLPC